MFKLIATAVAMTLMWAAPSFAQQVGTEPPSRSKAASPQPQPAPSKKAQSTSAIASGKLTLSSETLTQSIAELRGDIQRLDQAIGSGGSIVGRWAKTAELFTSYAEAAAAAELKCDLFKKRVQFDSDRGATQFVLEESKKALSRCQADTQRSNAATQMYARKLKDISETVEGIKIDVESLRGAIELNRSELIKKEAERRMDEAFRSAERDIQGWKGPK
jgi:hypothetical protein